MPTTDTAAATDFGTGATALAAIAASAVANFQEYVEDPSTLPVGAKTRLRSFAKAADFQIGESYFLKDGYTKTPVTIGEPLLRLSLALSRPAALTGALVAAGIDEADVVAEILPAEFVARQGRGAPPAEYWVAVEDDNDFSGAGTLSSQVIYTRVI